MKRISARMFFTAMWRGVCQAAEWLLSVFGRGKQGKFAKFVWGLFAMSASFIVVVLAVALLCSLAGDLYDWYKCEVGVCDRKYCWNRERLNGDIWFHKAADDEKGYVFNSRTREKLVDDVEWCFKPEGADTLVCFSDGEKRGYFGLKSGKVVVEPQYEYAWVFSEGLAAVVADGLVKFIDQTGKVVIDNKLEYDPEECFSYMFENDYCIIRKDIDGVCMGLMDRSGEMLLPVEYDFLCRDYETGCWKLGKDGKEGMVDQMLRPVMPMDDWTLQVYADGILAEMPDHTLRKYDLQGNLVYDFCVSYVEMLEYDEPEVLYRDVVEYDCGEVSEVREDAETYHPKGVARLCCYGAAGGYKGLMTAEGRVVTPPLYSDIEAIGPDRYLCEVVYGASVLLDGNGNPVK